MSDGGEFLPLRKADFHDAGEQGLAMRLETQRSTEGRAYAFGCLLSADEGRRFLQGLASALQEKGFLSPSSESTEH